MAHVAYNILDGARLAGNLVVGRSLNSVNLSLYKGRPEEDLAGVAPYLFSLEEGSDFANWVAHQGKGNSWGIYIASQAAFEAVHKHLRRFLMVQMEDTKEQVYFRYYDPRVLRIFLPTCDGQQLQELFGHVIQRFICEDEDPEFALIFSLRNGQLHTERRPATEVFPALLEEPIEVEPIIHGPTEEDEKYVREAYEAAGITPPGGEENQEAAIDEQEEAVVKSRSDLLTEETEASPKKSGGRRFKFID